MTFFYLTSKQSEPASVMRRLRRRCILFLVSSHGLVVDTVEVTRNVLSDVVQKVLRVLFGGAALRDQSSDLNRQDLRNIFDAEVCEQLFDRVRDPRLGIVGHHGRLPLRLHAEKPTSTVCRKHSTKASDGVAV